MLTPQQLEQLKSITSPAGQASKVMTPEEARSAFTTTPPTSSYDIAMGTKNADGTPNTQKGIIPQALDQAVSGFKQTREGAENPNILEGLQQIGRGTLNEMAAPIRAMFSPVEAGLKVVSQLPGFHQALGALQDHVINPTANAVSDNKHIQDFMKSNPHADEVFGNLLTIVGSVLGGKNAGEIKTATESAGQTIADTASSVASKVNETTNKIPGIATKTPEELATQLKASAVQDATPAYNKKLIGENPITNADGTLSPRVSEAKGLGKRIVNSTPKEITAGEELSKVPKYDPNATALDKYNTIKDYNISKSKDYRTSLANEKVVIPKKEIANTIKKAVNTASDNSLLLQKTDPIVKNYLRVANRAVANADGTIAGEDDIRLALDKAYKDAGGEYANNKGLDQIHRAARDAITADMETKAQTTQVKASLKEMSNLYNASDVLLEKARAEGGSKWEQFKKAHPTIMKIVKPAARAAGVGAGVHLIP